MAEDSFVLKRLRRASVCREDPGQLTEYNKTQPLPDVGRGGRHVWSYFTCSSLLEPFFRFCFLSSSYFLRPSRYSATASLGGILSTGERRDLIYTLFMSHNPSFKTVLDDCFNLF